MDVRVVDDLDDFEKTGGALYFADPVRHTVALTAMSSARSAPPERRPVMLTIHDGGDLVGAVLRTPPFPLLSSALPVDAIEPVAAVLAELDPDLPSVNGPRESAEALATAWTRRTGTPWTLASSRRLYRLGVLDAPVVAGAPRVAGLADLPLLIRWHLEFELESHGRERAPDEMREFVERSLGRGDGFVLWEVDGQAVALARACVPIDGMSRIAPVYTPPDQRERGYGSAVTAAVTRWGLDQGAEVMLLFTDLANPTSNSIYQKLGYRPVLDTVELDFATP